MKIKIKDTEIELVKGDITDLDTDVIVNAANKNLQLGSGVAGAIRNKGGPSIQKECNKIGSTITGGAVITGAGNLKARYVIHAVGPIMGEGNEDEKLKNATLNTLELADKKSLESVAFPAISTGVFGYPVHKCADIMLSNTIKYIKKKTRLHKIIFCLYDTNTFNIFKEKLEKLYSKDN